MIDPRVGGPQLRSLAVAKRLREHNIETEFLLPDGDDEFVNRARQEGFNVHRPGFPYIHPPKDILSNSKYIANFPLAVYRIQKVIQNREIDVVHANMSLNFDASIATWQSEAALIWHFNDVQMPWPLNRIAGNMGQTIADGLVVASESVADHYHLTSERNLNKIYAPVDTRKFDPDEVDDSGLHQELGLHENTVIVGSIGNLNPIKGHEYLLRAAPKITSKTESDLAIPIVGGILDSRKQYFEHLKEIRTDLGLEDTVHFLGYRSDIAELLSEFDVFVLPSIAEACPMTILEAMAMQKPVVGTNVGGIPEQINAGETGWLVPAKNPDALANAIIEAITDEKESQLRGRNAREKVIEEFSLDRCVERHIHAYKQAID